MSKSYKIRTTPGGGNGYLKVNVDLNQNYDFLEILSLKISQKDEYQNFCADYGVIAGRVIVNGGFGVPNVKVSIFVPVDDKDSEDPVKSAIYNYQTPNPDDKNNNGVRYNLLPKKQQTLDHTPVGTFPNKREILDDGTTLEIYQKYYKYTTTTNKAGDYILFGVPAGEHTLHYDMDVSDIGFLSTRPFELINRGYSDDLFNSRFKFGSSNNLETLPQIFSANLPVTVEPYWCDSLSTGSVLGITRLDIEPNVEIIPTSVFMGSVFSDDEKDSLNKNCKPDRQMGKMNEVITGSGRLEAIRRTVDGNIEKFNFAENSIDDNGNWSVLVPMNLRKVVTDEFGNLIPSPDGIKGVATEADFRFRISMDATSNDKRLRQRAKFLVPNTNNNFVFDEFSPKELEDTTLFTKNTDLSTITNNTPYSEDLRNQYNYLEEFYSFRWKKVYTVKQYIGRLQRVGRDEARGFIGIKDIYNSSGVNKYPTNRFDTNINILYGIICILLTVFGHVVGIINGILNIINGLVTQICQIKFPVGIRISLEYCFQIAGCGTCSQDYKDKCCSAAYTSLSDGCKNSDQGNCSGGAPCGPDCGSGCGKCKCNDSGDKEAEFSLKLYIKWKCLFSSLLCKKCRPLCDDEEPHSCCINVNGQSYTYGCTTNETVEKSISESPPFCPNCCGTCCVKIPLIPLRCAEEDFSEVVTIIPTPFAPFLCNRRFAAPFSCVDCGGLQTPVIKDWVSCTLEPLAVFLRMLKFDFYNDWVGGSLYFPLIKRKYKLKKKKRKFGQIKKDKFCDFDCRIRQNGNLTDNFQGEPTYNQWRIKIPNLLFSNPTITVEGCTAKIKGKRVTDWYGTPENDDETDNLNLAVLELKFNGKTSSGEGCVINFNEFSLLESSLNGAGVTTDLVKDREVPTTHGKPEYVETEDPSGFSSWENIGGHSHHRNICNDTRLMERKEFMLQTLNCEANVDIDITNELAFGTNDGELQNDETAEEEEPCGILRKEFCIEGCAADCGSNGVAPCKETPQAFEDYQPIIEHGLVSWYEGEIYYTPYIPKNDLKNNASEYKANLLLPTTIMELGSMNYCDIDDVPFIIDQLEPTTFQVSTEEFKYKGGAQNSGYDGPDNISGNADDGTLIEVKKLDDKKDASLNLRAYVEFSCFSVVCANTLGTVNQSQIGVDMIDKNDIGIEIGTCFMRFDHDEDIREYFCRRFNGYKDNLNFHHTRPGGIDTDNVYNTYPEITLIDGLAGAKTYYEMPDTGEVILSEFNDTDPFISGDGCGFKRNGNSIPDYFYGVAPGITGEFINYPNGSSTIDFGNNANGGDVIDNVEDDDNQEPGINGIRFNRSQTPYHLYFGLVPGKTALHKTVAKFFADKINAVTLQGLGESNANVEATTKNAPPINGGIENNFTVFKTCLGETLIKQIDVGTVQTITPPDGQASSNTSS